MAYFSNDARSKQMPLLFTGILTECIALMKVDEVRKIGRLARLALSDDEAGEAARTLSDILKLVAELDDAGLESVEPLAHPLDVVQRLRADRVTESDRRESLQAIAPQVGDGLYLVPKVLE